MMSGKGVFQWLLLTDVLVPVNYSTDLTADVGRAAVYIYFSVISELSGYKAPGFATTLLFI